MPVMNKEQFALLTDADYAFVDVTEPGEDGTEPLRVRVRSLMSDQRERLRVMSVNEQKSGVPVQGGINAWYCAMGMVDENGLPFFSSEAEGVSIMSKKHPELTARIADKIYELSKMTKWQREDAEKKSMKANSSGSQSSSAEQSTQASDSTTADS